MASFLIHFLRIFNLCVLTGANSFDLEDAQVQVWTDIKRRRQAYAEHASHLQICFILLLTYCSSMEKQNGMAFGFRKTATAVIKPDGWTDRFCSRNFWSTEVFSELRSTCLYHEYIQVKCRLGLLQSNLIGIFTFGRTFIHSVLSNDRSKASSKTIPPHSAI